MNDMLQFWLIAGPALLAPYLLSAFLVHYFGGKFSEAEFRFMVITVATCAAMLAIVALSLLLAMFTLGIIQGSMVGGKTHNYRLFPLEMIKRRKITDLPGSPTLTRRAAATTGVMDAWKKKGHVTEDSDAWTNYCREHGL